MLFELFDLLFNHLKHLINIDELKEYMCTPFHNYYTNILDNVPIHNLTNYQSYFNISELDTSFDNYLHYPSFNFFKKSDQLLDYFKYTLRRINKINPDDLFKTLYDDITQETIINDILNSINNNTNKIYELIMGSGKSSFIIPFVVFLHKYHIYDINNIEIINKEIYNNDEIMIICPNHLVNSMYNTIMEFIDLLPKNIFVFKKTNIDEYKYKEGQILIVDDVFIKHNLLTNSDKLLKHNNRIMFIDEIDNLMDPLNSEYNLVKELSNDIPNKKILFKLIYDLVYRYNQLEDKTNKKIKELFLNIDKTIDKNIKQTIAILFNCIFFDSCGDKNDSRNSDKLLEHHDRIMFIDEIDNLMDPLNSE